MTVKEYKNQFIQRLTPVYDALEAEQFFHLMLEERLGLKRIDLALEPNRELPQAEHNHWDYILEQLEREVPIQYLLGSTHFYGLRFMVNKAVLIPRPETEELVNWILKSHQNKNISILDIGTGSGCIAVALAKQLDLAKVSALDVSQAALDVAKQNAAANEVEVNFILQDILSTNDLNKKFDIIVSNPPYVRQLEKQEIKNNVLQHEPHLALFVDDQDALLFYRKICELALTSLADEGYLYFEINQYLGEQMIELLRNYGFKNIELRQDIYGNDRMIKGQLSR